MAACAGTTKKGARCTMPAAKASDFCYLHDPDPAVAQRRSRNASRAATLGNSKIGAEIRSTRLLVREHRGTRHLRRPRLAHQKAPDGDSAAPAGLRETRRARNRGRGEAEARRRGTAGRHGRARQGVDRGRGREGKAEGRGHGEAPGRRQGPEGGPGGDGRLEEPQRPLGRYKTQEDSFVL